MNISHTFCLFTRSLPFLSTPLCYLLKTVKSRLPLHPISKTDISWVYTGKLIACAPLHRSISWLPYFYIKDCNTWKQPAIDTYIVITLSKELLIRLTKLNKPTLSQSVEQITWWYPRHRYYSPYNIYVLVHYWRLCQLFNISLHCVYLTICT